MSTTPVLVVGGGPVGLTAALELAHHGVPAVVVESRATVDHSRPRAKTTSARSMELFRRTGVADEIRRRAAIPVDWSDEIRFCTTVSGDEITRLTGTLGLELVGSPLTSEAAQQVTQPVVEEALRAVIEREPLVTTLFGRRAVAVELEAVRPSVTIVDALGDLDVVECEYLIGADGSRSVVREALGARYVGAPGGRPNVNITFRSIRLAEVLRDKPAVHHWVLNPAGPGVVGPLDLTGNWWAIATGTVAISDKAEAVALVRGLVGDDVDVEVIATDPWQARLLLSNSYGSNRTYLVGDAAHQNPPWGGHGYNTGIGDAVNLAWKVAAVLQGWAPAELLGSYEAERRPVAEQTIDLAASNMRALSIELGNAAIMAPGTDGETARAAAAAVIPVAKRSEFYSLGLVLGYGYGPDAAAQAPSTDVYRPRVRPGNRLPHTRSADGSSLFDLLGREFTVLGSAAAAQPLIEAAVERGIPISHADPPTHGFAPVAAENVVLVRPDQHIAWCGRLSDQSNDPLNEPLNEPRAIIESAIRGFPS